jgi:hypothetical protein
MNFTSPTLVQQEKKQKENKLITTFPDPCFLPCLQSALHGSVSEDLYLLTEKVTFMQHDSERCVFSDSQQVDPNYEARLSHQGDQVGGIEISPMDAILPARSEKILPSSTSRRRAVDNHGRERIATPLPFTGLGCTTKYTNLVLPSLPRLDLYTPATLHPRTTASKLARLRDAAGDSNGLNKPH